MYSGHRSGSGGRRGGADPESATSLAQLRRGSRAHPARRRGHFRLLTGFNDIFRRIAAAILLLAVGWIGYYVPPNSEGDGPSPFMCLFVAVTALGPSRNSSPASGAWAGQASSAARLSSRRVATTVFGLVGTIGTEPFRG